MRKPNGFSEFEFLGLIAAGLLVAGLLAHFVFDQSIQLERLKALVQRDAVRLSVETNLLDIEVLKKSAQALPDNNENSAIRACLLGDEGNASCENRSRCCVSRMRRAIPIFGLGDSKLALAGSIGKAACLDNTGQPTTGECFATVKASLDAICPDGESTCRQASALLVRYQIQFTPAFLKSEPEVSIVERTLSVVFK